MEYDKPIVLDRVDPDDEDELRDSMNGIIVVPNPSHTTILTLGTVDRHFSLIEHIIRQDGSLTSPDEDEEIPKRYETPNTSERCATTRVSPSTFTQAQKHDITPAKMYAGQSSTGPGTLMSSDRKNILTPRSTISECDIRSGRA